MSSPTNPTSSGNQGDPWEQLAEDLFGLEYGKEHGLREPSPLAVEPVAPAAKSPPSVSVAQRQEPVSVTAPAEAEPQHSQDEPCLSAEPAFEEPETSPQAESSPEKGETSSPAAAETGSPQDSYWDALANWNWDESDGAASKSKSEPPRSSGGPPPRGGPRGRDDRRDRRGGEKPQRQTSSTSPPAAASPSAASPPHSATPRSSTPHSSTPHSSSTPPASAPRAPRPAAPHLPTSAAGDDFGLGVADSESDFSALKESRATEDRGASEPRRPVHDTASRAESPKPAPAADRGEHRTGSGERGTEPGPAKEEAGEFPRKRRRRRRRRSRGGDREPGSTTGATTGATTPPMSPTSGDEGDDSAGPEFDAPAAESHTPVADSREETKDDFEGDRSAPARGRRHGSGEERTRRERTRQEGTRHEGTGRRSNAGSSDAARSEDRRDDGPAEGRGDGPGELEEEPLLVGGGVEESAGDDDGEDDAGEQAVSYENVPSWEEAISYLLHPNQVQVEPGVGNGSAPPRQAPPADQPRQTRHMGSQKHRR